MPDLRRVAVLYNGRGENPVHAKSLSLIQKVAPTMGLKLVEKPVKFNTDIEEALTSVSKSNADGLFVICATLFREHQMRMAAVMIEKRLPLMACNISATDNHALLTYTTDHYRLGRRGAWYVDRILKGTKPQDLPVEAPTYFELS